LITGEIIDKKTTCHMIYVWLTQLGSKLCVLIYESTWDITK